MNAHAGSNRVGSASDAFVGIVSHLAGFAAGVLGAVAMTAVLGLGVWIVASHVPQSVAQRLAEVLVCVGLLMVLGAFIGTWNSAAAATRLAILKGIDPAKYEVVKRELVERGMVAREPATSEPVKCEVVESKPKVPAGYFSSVYRFSDAQGTVLLETQNPAEVKKALYSGRVRPESICGPLSPTGEPLWAKPLADSKFAKRDFMRALFKPFEYYDEVADRVGHTAGAYAFFAVWIAVTYQRNLAGLGWLAYFGALFVIMMCTGFGCLGVATVVGQMAAQRKMSIAKSLGYTAEGKPISELKNVAILLASGLALGSMLMLSVRAF